MVFIVAFSVLSTLNDNKKLRRSSWGCIILSINIKLLRVCNNGFICPEHPDGWSVGGWLSE